MLARLYSCVGPKIDLLNTAVDWTQNSMKEQGIFLMQELIKELQCYSCSTPNIFIDEPVREDKTLAEPETVKNL